MMSSVKRIGVVLGVLVIAGSFAAPEVSAQTTTRPLSDYIDAQTCTFWWWEPDGNWVFFDYNGFVNEFANDGVGLGLETTLDGYVKERALKDGGTKISVAVHGNGALTYAADPTFSFLIFGYVWQEIVYLGAEPSLGNFLMTVEFVSDQAPGGPLPNLCDLQPGQEVTKLSFVGNGDGALRADFGVPEGTPGKVHTTQQARFLEQAQGGPHEDGFAAEKVNVWATGN